MDVLNARPSTQADAGFHPDVDARAAPPAGPSVRLHLARAAGAPLGKYLAARAAEQAGAPMEPRDPRDRPLSEILGSAGLKPEEVFRGILETVGAGPNPGSLNRAGVPAVPRSPDGKTGGFTPDAVLPDPALPGMPPGLIPPGLPGASGTPGTPGAEARPLPRLPNVTH